MPGGGRAGRGGFDGAGVQGLPTLLDKPAIGHLVGEGVLERVLEVGEEARLVKELGGLKVSEATAQLIVGHLGDRPEEYPRDVLADDGRALEAKSTVTRLRSPSSALLEVRILAGRYLDV